MPNNQWRISVKARDGGCCVICAGIGTNAHHIYCEGYYPELRNDINNGVTLCRACHSLVHRGKFGATSKGKYSAKYSREQLERRAASSSVFPLIADLVMADVKSTEYALSQRIKNQCQGGTPGGSNAPDPTEMSTLGGSGLVRRGVITPVSPRKK